MTDENNEKKENDMTDDNELIIPTRFGELNFDRCPYTPEDAMRFARTVNRTTPGLTQAGMDEAFEHLDRQFFLGMLLDAWCAGKFELSYRDGELILVGVRINPEFQQRMRADTN